MSAAFKESAQTAITGLIMIVSPTVVRYAGCRLCTSPPPSEWTKELSFRDLAGLGKGADEVPPRSSRSLTAWTACLRWLARKRELWG